MCAAGYRKRIPHASFSRNGLDCINAQICSRHRWRLREPGRPRRSGAVTGGHRLSLPLLPGRSAARRQSGLERAPAIATVADRFVHSARVPTVSCHSYIYAEGDGYQSSESCVYAFSGDVLHISHLKENREGCCLAAPVPVTFAQRLCPEHQRARWNLCPVSLLPARRVRCPSAYGT